MAVRDEVQRRIDKKRSEIMILEAQLRDAKVYIQALEDTLKILPHDPGEDSGPMTSGHLRPGSKVDRAREAIRSVGRSLHISDLMNSLGIDNTPANRAALSGSLSAYARRGEVFTRPAPNTFGLLEFAVKPKTNGQVNAPPANFGIDVPQDPDYVDANGANPEVAPMTDDDVPF